MRRCAKCGTSIPDGKTYCSSCYSRLMGEYQEAMTRYTQQSAHWGSLSFAERMAYHNTAEKAQLKNYTVVFFVILTLLECIIGGSAGIFGKLYFILLVGGTIGAGIVISRRFWFISGRIIRGLFKGSLWFIGISFIGYIFFKIGILDKLPEKLQKLNDVYIVMGIFGLVGFIIGIKREMSGKYHAYGGPRRPSRPPQ